jgi:hypothetical protein
VRPLARASSAAPGAPERAPGAGVGSPDGQVSLRSGAASSVTWSLRGNELRIAPVLRQGQVRRSFFLSSPPRVVFDVEGLAPASNTVTEASGPSVSRVRVGAQGTATRVVVDLVRPPRRATSVDAAMVLTYPDP